MRPTRIFHALLLAITATVAHAQILETKTVNGKEIMCARSGLSSSLKDCGPGGDVYTYVFTGTIASIAPIPNSDEETLQLVPDEVFVGQPPTPLTVQTEQALCALTPIHVGDRWLFRIYKGQKKSLVIGLYTGSSGSITNAYIQREVATYRRLKTIGSLGLLQGSVFHGEYIESATIPNALVTAANPRSGISFTTTTDAEGHYEFQPLTPGRYNLTVAPIGAYKADRSYANVEAGVCWDVSLDREAHGEISGRILRANGSPATNIDLVIIDADNTGYTTLQTDGDGRFDSYAYPPGKYILGVNFPPNPTWFNGSGAGADLKLPPASWFYPGVQDRSHATILTLNPDQKLTNINITLPTH